MADATIEKVMNRMISEGTLCYCEECKRYHIPEYCHLHEKCGHHQR